MNSEKIAMGEENANIDDLADLLEDMLAETGGPLTAAELRAADEALRDPQSKRRTRSAR